MQFQKRLFSRVPVLVCLVVTLAALTSVAFADKTERVYTGCSGCGKATWQNKVVVGSCDTGYTITYTCLTDSHVHGIDVEPRSHGWKPYTIESPTCTAGSLKGYRCSYCGDYREGDTYFDGEPLGHDWSETARIPATCIIPGSIGYACSRCDETKTETIPQLAFDHTWVEVSRTDATCTAGGFVSYGCSVCHETKTDPLPALGHDWTETSRIPATCTNPGSIDRTCSRCGFTASEELPALGSGHTWMETSRVDPTATASGSVEYICSTCNAARTETLPALGSSGSMTELLTAISVVLAASLGWVSVVAGKIAENPVLLFVVVISFLGTVMLLFKRMLHI